MRDEEKERYDRKSLALSPLPASPETCNTHPQHSGLLPPACMRSPEFFCVSAKFPSTVFSLFHVPLFCFSLLLLYFYPLLIVCELAFVSQTCALLPCHFSLSLWSHFIASQLSAASISITLFSSSLWILLHLFLFHSLAFSLSPLLM